MGSTSQPVAGVMLAVGRFPMALNIKPFAPQIGHTSGKAETSKVLQGVERGK
jgi:hypothetical protein